MKNLGIVVLNTIIFFIILNILIVTVHYSPEANSKIAEEIAEIVFKNE